MNDELFAFIIRETGWTLEYTRSVPLTELYQLASELGYLKEIEAYQTRANFAALISVMAKCWGGKDIEISELVGEPPKRPQVRQKEDEIWLLAQRAGIRIPQDRS